MDLVKQLRRKKGWSQEHLAQAADVARATIQRIELGQVVPSKETLQSLAAAFGVDPEEIRSATGRAALVYKVMEISLQRDATARELAPLSPDLRALFVEYYAARTAMAAFNENLERVGARSTAAFEASQAARQEWLQTVRAASINPRDAHARDAFMAASTRSEDLSRTAGEAASAIADATRGGAQVMRRLNEATLEIMRVLIQFV